MEWKELKNGAANVFNFPESKTVCGVHVTVLVWPVKIAGAGWLSQFGAALGGSTRLIASKND